MNAPARAGLRRGAEAPPRGPRARRRARFPAPPSPRPVRTFLVLALLAAAASGCGGAPPLYASTPIPAEAVDVDGDAGEWPSALRPVPREPGLSLGLRRTDDALFVAVIARDERQAQRVVLGGLRLWLDPEGGTERVVGVRFPTPPPPSRVDIRRAGGEAGPQILRRRFEAARRPRRGPAPRLRAGRRAGRGAGARDGGAVGAARARRRGAAPARGRRAPRRGAGRGPEPGRRAPRPAGAAPEPRAGRRTSTRRSTHRTSRAGSASGE